MAVTFVARKKAKEYLHGQWHTAIAVQVSVFTAEAALLTAALWLPGSALFVTSTALLIDVLMLSPLKAGRAFFFETLTADSEAATLSLLFRYYRYGYEKTVGWRLFVWGNRLLWSVLLYLPALLLFAFSRILGENTPTQAETLVSLICFAVGVLLTVTAGIVIEIILLRLQPIPYLLSHTGKLRSAVSLSYRITKGRTGVLTLLCLDHIGGAFLSLLILPWPYTSSLFHTAKAATVRRFLAQIPEENATHVLQRRKKYDKMSR